MEATTTSRPVRHRRHHRLGIDAHTSFVATLVSELDTAVAGLQTAARSLAEIRSDGEVDVADSSHLDRSVADLLRLVRLLNTIDGPDESHHLHPISLADAVVEAAKGLNIEVTVPGVAGGSPFHGVAESFRLGAEMVLLAFARPGVPVEIDIPHDHVVVVRGALDLNDELRAWQLRCGRRVLEGEDCRVRLTGGRGSYRLEIRVEP